MIDRDLGTLRREVRKVGQQIAQADALLERRGALVEQARAEGMTWRELAKLLDMTETGLMKSQKAYRVRASSIEPQRRAS